MSEIKSIQTNSKHQKNRNVRKIPKRITETYLHNSGLYYLEKYSASSKHFKTVMMRKVKRSCMHHKDQNYEECSELVNELTNKFITSGLLNDDLYVQSMVRSYRNKGFSKQMIVKKLQVKGIEPDKTFHFLEIHDAENSECKDYAEQKAAAILCRKKKLGAFSNKEKDDTEKNKEIAKLARAGFKYDVVKRVLDMQLSELTDLIYKH